MTEPQETSAGEMRPEDVPNELVAAAAKAIQAAHAHAGSGPRPEFWDEVRIGLAAALTKLGLREEWGTRWEGHERVQSFGYGPDAEATARETTHPRDTVVRRYVTDWEDVDA